MTRIDSKPVDFYTATRYRMDRGRLFRMMWSKNSLRLGIVGVVALSGFGIAAAQTGSDSNASVAMPAASENKEDMNLTPAQMRAAANQYLPAMEQSAQTIRRQLEQARESRDVVKVLCLNDKLNQVDVALRSTKDRVQSLSGAADHNDVERSRHEFTVVQVLRDRVRALSQEASQCIGEETGFIDEPKVRVEIDPAIPKQDPTVVPVDPTPIFVPPPPPVSPTR
ncbi:MAG TPA: hypothetical protein VIV60_34045 [Polyangiaceae bacterium]